MAQNSGPEIFEPGEMFRDQVELNDVGARSVGSEANEINLSDLAGGEIARKRGTAVIPVHFFFIVPQKVSAEADNAFRDGVAAAGQLVRPEFVTRRRKTSSSPGPQTVAGLSSANARVAT